MKHPLKHLLVVTLSLVTVTLFAQINTMNTPQPSPPTHRVSLDDMRNALTNSSAVVIDIREPAEHATGVASGAALMPLSRLGAHINELPKPTDPEFYVVCHTQNRSSRVVEQLHSMGYTNARYVHGGMSEWNGRGLPTVRP
jgi:rhodanese-related sulfurtransferase